MTDLEHTAYLQLLAGLHHRCRQPDCPHQVTMAGAALSLAALALHLQSAGVPAGEFRPSVVWDAVRERAREQGEEREGNFNAR
jgi:hypothetical protein